MISKSPPKHDDVLVPRSLMEDSRLSWKAKGLMLCILADRPNNEVGVPKDEIDFDSILKSSNCGIYELNSTVDELISHGYVNKSEFVEFVYLVKSVWSGFYKIGRTRGYSVESRLSSMRTGDPSLQLIAKVKAGKEFERELHNDHSLCCVDREWFKLSEYQASLLSEKMKRIDKHISESTRGGT